MFFPTFYGVTVKFDERRYESPEFSQFAAENDASVAGDRFARKAASFAGKKSSKHASFGRGKCF